MSIKKKCERCGGRGYVYALFDLNAGGYSLCCTCQSKPPPVPEWLQPAGQSIVLPGRDSDGLTRLARGQT